jgi:hypothetical protein
LSECSRISGYGADDFDWSRDQGARVVQAEELWNRSAEPLMEEVRSVIGPETPTYLSFDIDGLDPSVAPGTGTPEPGGLTGPNGAIWADVTHFGRGESILRNRQKIKRSTLAERRLHYQRHAA